MNPADEADFREFVTYAHTRLLRTAYLLTGDRHQAEDLTQMAFVKAALAWRRVRSVEDPLSYVRRILTNAHISAWRRARRLSEHPTSTLPEMPTLDLGQRRCEDRDQLRAALRVLSPRQRAVVVLRYYEDLTVEDTALTLGCSVGTVKSTASRALLVLRAHVTSPEATCTTS